MKIKELIKILKLKVVNEYLKDLRKKEILKKKKHKQKLSKTVKIAKSNVRSYSIVDQSLERRIKSKKQELKNLHDEKEYYENYLKSIENEIAREKNH